VKLQGVLEKQLMIDVMCLRQASGRREILACAERLRILDTRFFFHFTSSHQNSVIAITQIIATIKIIQTFYLILIQTFYLIHQITMTFQRRRQLKLISVAVVVAVLDE
jgi:hypothetical protein